MADNTIYTSYVTINGHLIADFVCYEGRKKKWALQSFGHNEKPCKHYRVKSPANSKAWCETSQDEAVRMISGD